VCISLYHFALIQTLCKKNKVIICLSILYFIFLIYGFASVFEGKELHVYYDSSITLAPHKFLLAYSFSILPVFSFYYYALRNKINKIHLLCIFLISIVVCLLDFYQTLLAEILRTGNDEITNNSGYLFLSLISFLFILDFGKIKKICFAIIFLGIIFFGLKRGAILIGVIMAAHFFFHTAKSFSKRQRLIAGSILILLLVIFVYFIIDFYNTSPYFQIRLQNTLEGKSSGRDEYYTTYFAYFTNEYTIIQMLFGDGAYATVANLGDYAHNDWIEIALNHGLIGVFFYFIFYVSFLNQCRSYKESSNIRNALLSLLIMMFCRSFFSMSINSLHYTASLCLGYCLATIQKSKTKKTIKNKLQCVI